MNILQDKCCDDCPDYDPCEDCPQERCPPNTGKCCPEPRIVNIKKISIWQSAPYFRFVQGKATKVEVDGATRYYSRHSDIFFEDFEYLDERGYPVCCSGNQVLYEQGRRRCEERSFWKANKMRLINYNNESGVGQEDETPTGQFIYYFGFNQTCSCELMLHNSALSNGDFPASLLNTLPASPLGGKTFYENRYQWVNVFL